jgi:hypothetical protein
MGHRKARVGGREQSRHRGWMRIVAAGPSIDAESVVAVADNYTDWDMRKIVEMNSLHRYTGYPRTAFKKLEVSGWRKKE